MRLPLVFARVLYAVSLCAQSGCLSPPRPANIAIRMVTDSVRLNRMGDQDWFNAQFVITNNGTEVIFGPQYCSFGVQRYHGGTWTDVALSNICLATLTAPTRILPGDSIRDEVMAVAASRRNPASDASMSFVPGEYRLVLLLGRRSTPGAVADLLNVQSRTTPPFVVLDTTAR